MLKHSTGESQRLERWWGFLPSEWFSSFNQKHHHSHCDLVYAPTTFSKPVEAKQYPKGLSDGTIGFLAGRVVSINQHRCWFKVEL
jgi:hypothetical protein